MLASDCLDLMAARLEPDRTAASTLALLTLALGLAIRPLVDSVRRRLSGKL